MCAGNGAAALKEERVQGVYCSGMAEERGDETRHWDLELDLEAIVKERKGKKKKGERT